MCSSVLAVYTRYVCYFQYSCLLLLALTTCWIDEYLESVIEVSPDALKIAANLDGERQQGTVRSSLHGIPVQVKDVSYTEYILSYL